MHLELRFLLDMGISAAVTPWLRERGYDAKHIRDIDPRTPDHEIVRLAIQELRIVLTADTDVGALLASSALRSPSVVLFRLKRPKAAVLIPHLEHILSEFPDRLAAGCLISVSGQKPYRIRTLPRRTELPL
jgi:predicted nuclease of predicted toxin-antitoxin system